MILMKMSPLCWILILVLGCGHRSTGSAIDNSDRFVQLDHNTKQVFLTDFTFKRLLKKRLSKPYI